MHLAILSLVSQFKLIGITIDNIPNKIYQVSDNQNTLKRNSGWEFVTMQRADRRDTIIRA